MDIYYQSSKDGTLKIFNPLVGDEVWIVPGRSGRPITNQHSWNAKRLAPGQRTESSCNFCPGNLVHTPAEKSRLVLDGANQLKRLDHLLPAEAALNQPLFRRVPNLYEIVPWEYWKSTYGLCLNQKQRVFKKAYLADQQGREHLKQVLYEKLTRLGESSSQLDAMGEAVFEYADAFFGGSHDLIVSGGHYAADARKDSDLLASGSLSMLDHLRFLDYSFEAAEAMRQDNLNIVWVSLYQNWLASAGASFDHLHKQVLGLDQIPPALRQRQEVLQREPDFYNQCLLKLVKKQNLTIAENEHAIALVDPGHAYPTLAVISKASARTWKELAFEEKKSLSDLLWLCHQRAGVEQSANEEWLQSADNGPAIPVHVLVKWRMNTAAGFEGGSKIHLNPMFPAQVREKLLNAELPSLQGIRWGDDCACEVGSLGR